MSLSGHYGDPTTRLALTVLTRAAAQLDRAGRVPFIGLSQVPALTAWLDVDDSDEIRVEESPDDRQQLAVVALKDDRRRWDTTISRKDSLSSIGRPVYHWLRDVIPDAHPVTAVDTPEDAERLPAGTVIMSTHHMVMEKDVWGPNWWYAMGVTGCEPITGHHLPARILYLPGEES